MVEKEGIDIDDSTESELIALEEVDLSDQIEIVPEEEETDKTLEVSQEEVVSEIAEDESIPPDSDTTTEVDELPSPGDTELEISSKETETTHPLETTDDDKDGLSETDELDGDNFMGLDDEELDNELPEKQDPLQEEEVLEYPEGDQTENKSEMDDEPTGNLDNNSGNDGDSAKSSQRSKSKITFRKPTRIQIIIGLIVALMLTAGGVFYMKPAFLGFEKETSIAAAQKNALAPSVQIVSEQETPEVSLSEKVLTAPAVSPSKNEVYLSKIRDAGRLRDELLSKKEEIYLLELQYQNGIADLEEQIYQELQKEGITSLKDALKRRRIELKLRTIQRRRSYIVGLEKPTRWITLGIEELLYLKRKAELDLQMIDIAGGIDMDRHMRHISAAIQKFRPSAEKLALNRENIKPASLETIWRQIKSGKKKTDKSLPNLTDKNISDEICLGNYERTADLTSMSIETAQCLSKMSGPDLFLNNLTELSPKAAKSLFQWRGSWICMNGIQKLSPATAKYIFKWDGNWISLNGLIEFPPELATYLMEWEGHQLELMGLRYNKKSADKKALKYLALWETMGGKLFISDDIRKEIERALM